VFHHSKKILIALPFSAFLFAVCACFLSCNETTTSFPRAQNGVLDLQSRDFSRSDPVELSGEWKFKWLESGPACAQPEYDDSAWETFDVPNYWNSRVNAATGYGWFRLKVKNVNPAGERLGVYMEKMQTAGRIFVNGEEVLRDGTPGRTKETTRAGAFPQVAELPVGNEYVIAWQIANYHGQSGGPRYAPIIGLHHDLVRSLWLSDSKDAFIFGFVFMMAFYNFILWLMWRKEKASLFFALACFALVGRLMIMAPLSQRFFWDADIWDVRTMIEVIAITITFTMITNFLGCLYPREISRRFIRIGSLIAVVTIALILGVPGFLNSVLIKFAYIPIGFFGAGMLAVLALAVRRGLPGAKIMLTGIIVLIAACINDLISANVPSFPTINLLGYGLMGIVLSYSAFLSYRFARLSSNLQKEVGAQTEKITEQNRDLERLIKEKTEVFINFNHETKTPLTLISNYLEKYTAEHGEDASLTIMRQNLDKLLSDVTNSLDLEKLIRNQTFYRHDLPIAFTALVREKVRLFEPTARRKELSLAMADAPDRYVKIDPFALDRMLNNLLDNAVRYTDRGGTITVAVSERKDKIILRIADTGKGIPEKQRDKIFEPYYQISQQKGNLQGMGMGLAIVKKIMDSLQGEISVTSQPGKGTVFSLSFYLCDSPEEGGSQETLAALSMPVYQEATALRPETHEPSKDTLLFIEDNKNLLAYLQESLADEFNVFYACSGREAVLKLGNIPEPQLIVSDIMMDEMDGYEFLDFLLGSESYKSIPLVFLTARNLPGENIKGLARGAVDVVHKPFSIDELRSKIRSLIQSRKSQREALVREIQGKIGGLLTPGGEERPAPSAPCEDYFIKYKITGREREIVNLLLQGLEYKEIAERMGISFNTVRPYVSSVYRKCGVQNKVELANLFKSNYTP
jgi:signal transduction histidine kinase/DNA-binding NarL/FixJ family response regulator